eukprot:CAMPEP_0206594096 /NCGR_PEP_ID=MMETSP0325_2-20121206/42136_1 /ASSEMBLY_ACC=CAM_ASM_000347 /TAXON_ID=2866 /ORGANISM="Crypthecodinium cohnii, Strain Seligo" /LENGTH=32 /DNA_ID= /DNA_START= /DNA_END= /DNA_ORIENTATION=
MGAKPWAKPWANGRHRDVAHAGYVGAWAFQLA